MNEEDYPQKYAGDVDYNGSLTWNDLLERWKTTDENLFAATKTRAFIRHVHPFLVYPSSAARRPDLWFRKQEIEDFETEFPEELPTKAEKPGRRVDKIAGPLMDRAREMLRKNQKPDGTPSLTVSAFIQTSAVKKLIREDGIGIATEASLESFKKRVRRYAKTADPPVVFAKAKTGRKTK